MASVWRGIQYGAAGFSRTVAIKHIKPQFRTEQSYIAMFVEEARVGSDLAHPNIAQVHDFVVDAGHYFLVMEWIDGMDLRAFIRAYSESGRYMPWQIATSIAIGALRGLGAAHERLCADGSVAPVVHRDVSPPNILLGANGIVKLTDFGLARARDRMYRLTAPGTVKGKISYLSPEVTRGQDATPQSDLFAMGSVLFEMLAGERLFDAKSDVEVFQQVRECRVRPLEPIRPGAPEDLLAIIYRALQPDPQQRFRSARAMAHELRRVLRMYSPLRDWHSKLATHVLAARRKAAKKRRLSTPQPGPPAWSYDIEIDDETANGVPAQEFDHVDSVDVEIDDPAVGRPDEGD